MPDMAKHALTELPAAPKTSVKVAAWTILAAMGGTSVTFNIWHATHITALASHALARAASAGNLNIGLAILYGIAPVLAAMCLSHIAAEHDGMSGLMTALVYAVMAGAMALSMSAIAAVLGPAAGSWQRWLFGGVLDTASLVCLRIIIVQKERKIARLAAEEAAEKAREEAIARAREEAIARATAEARVKAEREAAERATAEAAERAREEAAAKALAAARKAAENPSRDPDAQRAVRAYRKSVFEGEPLSDRALGAMFKRSRTWGASRISEADADLSRAGRRERSESTAG